MSPIRRRFWFALVFSCVAGALPAAEQAPAAKVGYGPGVLASSGEAGGPWRVLSPGDVLPEECLLRSADAGPTLVDLAGGVLHIGPDTRLKLNVRKRAALVESGRIFLKTEAESSWSASAEALRVTLQPQSAVELAVKKGGPVAACVVQGTSTVRLARQKQITLPAGQAAAWKPGDKGLAAVPLAPEEQKRIARWTSAKASPQGLGQLLITDAQSGSATRLNVARYHVNVVLQPPVALVQIDQSFYNPYSRQEEGTFVFNLPRGASVSRFAMYVTRDRLIEGELIERQRASNIYESIVRRKRDPAILEQIGDNLFRMRVFPIFAKDTKRILLDYTLPVKPEHGECRFRLPLLSDLEPIWDFRLSGVIRGPAELGSVRSLSHPRLRFQRRDDGTITFDFGGHDYQPKTDFSLSFVEKPKADTSLQSYAARPLPTRVGQPRGAEEERWSGRLQTFFLASLQPESGRAPAKAPPPADVLILADTSSGMRSSKLLRRAVRTVMGNLRPADRVRLVSVDVGARAVHEGWLAPQEAETAAVINRFQREFCLGGTDLAASFREAVSGFEDTKRNRRRLVVYVGDGEDTLSEDLAGLPGRLADELDRAGAPLVGVIVRADEEGRKLLESVVRSTGGLLFDLASGGTGHGDLFRWLLGGLPGPEKIVEVAVEGVVPDDLFYPTAWLPGETLNILGRTGVASQVQLTLTTAVDGKLRKRRWALPVEGREEDVFIGRLWAQRKLDRLRREEKLLPDPNRQKRIVALSQEWSLLSPYTAFLVLETEAEYARWDIDRRQRRRYWKPAEALPREPLPEDWVARVTPDSKADEKEQKQREAARFAGAIRSAQEALDAGDYARALSLLEGVRPWVPKAGSREYARLRRLALGGVQTHAALERLGPARSLLDPARFTRIDLQPSVGPLLTVPIRVGADFLRRHPHAERLLQEVRVEPRTGKSGKLILSDLAAEAQDLSGVNVLLDRRALDDVGIPADCRIELYGSGRMSLRSYLRFVLRQLDLVMVEEPNRLWITTPEEMEMRLTTEVHPVADLLRAQRVADMGLLADPYMDREQAAKERIRAKLERPTPVEFLDLPLAEVVGHFAKVLDDTVLVDRRALDDVGIPMDTPITAFWRDVPVKDSLRWILDQLDLVYMIDDEALIITTPEEKENHLVVGLHSGRGIVFGQRVSEMEWRMRRDAQRSGGGWGGMMGMGAMGGGFGGSMGGMGGFGGFGGGMGGMGRFGGGMGGFGGMGAGGAAMGGFGGGSSGGQAGLSISVMPAETEPEAAPGQPAPEPAIGAPQADPWGEASPGPDRLFYDVDSVVEQVKTTIAPDSWDDVGGWGSFDFFEPTLDFVLAATDEVHDQIESLFDRLRRLPNELDEAWHPAQSHDGVTLPFDLESLIDIIKTIVDPDTWDDVGGPCSIAPDEPRLALIVSATADTHDGVWQLLTMLRRSRYEALRSRKPWETAGTVFGRARVGELGITALATETRLSEFPAPQPEELAALAVRRVDASGAWKWRRIEPGQDAEEVLTLRRAGGRMELEFPEGLLRADGDAAAIGYPSLALVELGNWGEAARQTADAWLPWLPHRTNEELARLFQVERLDSKASGNDPDVLRLRLHPQGSPKSANTYLEVVFSRKTGLAQAWESYLGGDLTGRLRFADPAGRDAPPAWRTVVLEDASGKPLARWELVESDAGVQDIPELTTGWEGYLSLDRRFERPAVDQAFHRALEAMRKHEWPAALHELTEAAKSHPRHPLLLLLTAWCYEHDRRLGSRGQLVAALGEVARSSAVSLLRFIGQENFSWLEPKELYEILSLAPRSKRSAVDWDHLAAAATKAGRLEEAAEHAQAALEAGARGGRQFERTRVYVELLLKLRRTEAATQAAKRWAAASLVTPEQLATMGELLAGYGSPVGDGLLAQALAGQGLTPEHRYNLLWRRARLHSGITRWRMLLEAASLMPADSPQRRECTAALKAELNQPMHAESVGTLASGAGDASLRAELLVRQAELTADPAAAADIAWKVFQSGQLPEGRFAWATHRWTEAGQSDRVIRASEQWLRLGKELPPTVPETLAEAYRSADRLQDARRASSADPPPPAPPTPPVGSINPGSPFGPVRWGSGMF